MHRRQQPGNLPQGSELEHRVVQCRLALEENASELEHHAHP
jgi:hypothetical protein